MKKNWWILLLVIFLLWLMSAAFPELGAVQKQLLRQVEKRPVFPLSFFGTEWWALFEKVEKIEWVLEMWSNLCLLFGIIVAAMGLFVIIVLGHSEDTKKAHILKALSVFLTGGVILCFLPQLVTVGGIYLLVLSLWGVFRGLWGAFRILLK